MNDEWLIPYLAGFFDGEGTIVITRKQHLERGTDNTYYELHAGVGQKVTGPLELYKKTFSGGIYYHRNGTHKTDFWTWRVFGSNARTFLETVLPYLSLKAEEARVGIEFQQQQFPNDGHRHKQTEEKMFRGQEFKNRLEAIRKNRR